MGSTQITEAILALNRLDASEPIWLFLNSGGGSIDAAFIVYDTIRMSSAPVYTVGEMCASAATLLLAAGAKRFIYPHTRTMLHLPSGSIEGDVREISIRTTEFQRVRDGLVDAYIDCGVRKTREQVLSDIDREMWMSPGETIGYGLADTVIDAATLFGECIGERVK
jgi:ATP-dependent Clp protease protease subunit